MIVGIDEVGRGSWAGPLCVAAVAWPDHAVVKGLNDSKKVPAGKRDLMARSIRELALDIGIGWVPAALIDKHGLTWALRHAAEAAVASLNVEYSKIIVDGNLKLIDDPRAVNIIKADTSEPSVMAASIIAKVARDTYMKLVGELYANYNFAKHVGYGTKMHQTMLEQFGPCELHRFSFSPVKAFIA
jgi:ribonuclease HII